MPDREVDTQDVTWRGARDRLATDVRRVADRLRSLSPARLAAQAPPHASRATAARVTAQVLADAAQGIEERDRDDEPIWRSLPTLHDFTVGDQVAVTGHDLLTAAAAVAAAEPVWAHGARRTAQEVFADAARRLEELRGLL
jgi:hypothetical protein